MFLFRQRPLPSEASPLPYCACLTRSQAGREALRACPPLDPSSLIRHTAVLGNVRNYDAASEYLLMPHQKVERSASLALARLSTFASKTPAVAGVLLIGLHYTVDFAASAASLEIFGGGWAGNVSPSRSSKNRQIRLRFDIARQGNDPPVGRRHDDVDHLHRAELADDLSRREDERDHDLQTVTPLVAAVAVALEIALEGLRTVDLEVRTREVEEDDVARRAK